METEQEYLERRGAEKASQKSGDLCNRCRKPDERGVPLRSVVGELLCSQCRTKLLCSTGFTDAYLASRLSRERLFGDRRGFWKDAEATP